jgi:hypothetical protein
VACAFLDGAGLLVGNGVPAQARPKLVEKIQVHFAKAVVILQIADQERHDPFDATHFKQLQR